MNLFHFIKLAIVSLATDRAVQVGGSTSGMSLWGGFSLADTSAHLDAAQQWVALYAAIIGALTATATLVYMAIKIKRLIKDPSAKE